MQLFSELWLYIQSQHFQYSPVSTETTSLRVIDFIQSGEDQFVRILRVLLNGLLIVFLYNYAVNILCIKTGDGYGFYCLLKQVEIDVQSTSNRKLPNFYEKVTDFLWESYRISK